MEPNPYEPPREENPQQDIAEPTPPYDWKRLFIYGAFLVVCCPLARFIVTAGLRTKVTTDPIVILVIAADFFGFPLGIVMAVVGGIGWLTSRLIRKGPTRPSSL